MPDDKGFVYKAERFNLLSGKFLAFVGVFILLVLAALNYLNIFSPSFLNFLPRKAVETSVTKSIGFASEVQGYTLGVKGNDHKALINSLEKLGFWDKKQSAAEEKTSTVLILLVGSRSGDMVDFTDKERGILFSYSKAFSKESVLIKIHLDDETLQKDTASQEVGKYLGFIFETMVVEKSLSAKTVSILEEIQNNIILTKNEQLIRTIPSIVPSKAIESDSTK